MIDIRQPNITAETEKDQLLQMRSYLYQLAQQLQWAFGTISGGGDIQNGASYTASGASKANESGSPGVNFAELKNLIIKSSEIVDSFYQEISKRLDGVYVADSDFGKYKQETSATIVANSTNINKLFTNTQTISDTVEVLHNAMIATSAYIKTGLLYENESGIPVYGLEVGQTNDVNGVNVFTKFARFSADRLSFYDRNNTEIAYISDYKLYITNAEITGALFLTGKFKIHYNNGLAFQWIGGGS